MRVLIKNMSFVEFVTYYSMYLKEMSLHEIIDSSSSYGLKEIETRAAIYRLIKKRIIRPQYTFGFDKKEPLTWVVKNNPKLKINARRDEVFKSALLFRGSLFGLKKKIHNKENRKLLSNFYLRNIGHIVNGSLKKDATKIKDTIFLAKECAYYGKKFKKDKSKSAAYLVSVGLYYYKSGIKNKASVYLAIAAEIYKQLHDIYNSLEYYQFAFSLSRD